jgi:hypothetical protein
VGNYVAVNFIGQSDAGNETGDIDAALESELDLPVNR